MKEEFDISITFVFDITPVLMQCKSWVSKEDSIRIYVYTCCFHSRQTMNIFGRWVDSRIIIKQLQLKTDEVGQGGESRQ